MRLSCMYVQFGMLFHVCMYLSRSDRSLGMEPLVARVDSMTNSQQVEVFAPEPRHLQVKVKKKK